MTTTTCKVWGCSRPVDNFKNARSFKYCKHHIERNQHNGHPTFKPPALARHHASYNQELTMALQGGMQWYPRADLKHFEKSFGGLLDDAESLKVLSPYRRLGDLPVRTQLLYLLKAAVEAKGRHETMKRWLCMYLAANHKRSLFPNRKTFAVFVCRKSLHNQIKLPEHITPKGNRYRYCLNANRALKMLDILEPIFELSLAPANNLSLWYRFYSCRLNVSNKIKQSMQEKHENNPNYASSLTQIRILKSIERKYLGG